MNTEIESNLHIFKHICRTVAQEASHEYLRLLLQATPEAVETALSDVFTNGTAKVQVELKNGPYKFTETIHTDMAEKKTLEKIFDRSINY